jgi:hypothetical protein
MLHRFKKYGSFTKLISIIFLVLTGILVSCNRFKHNKMEEQISVRSSFDSSDDEDQPSNSIRGNASLNQLTTKPFVVLQTGLLNHRLIPIYRVNNETTGKNKNLNPSFFDDCYGYTSEEEEHYMPGIDILFGYDLLNISHYDLKTDKQNLFFDHPVLINTLYYPAFIQDSIDNKPINRNYYFVSVYDEDTNKDSLINRKDLRRFFHFDENGSTKTLLVPADYSVIHSQYDWDNDLMYIFSRQDANKNGIAENNEPIHVFCVNLKTPMPAKRLY